MEIVNFLAEFWGFSFIIISLAFLINPKNIEDIIELVGDKKNVLMFGIINVMIGVASVLLYNVWDSSWKVIITIIAWLIVIRGIVCLFFPDIIKKIIETKIKIYKDWFSVVFVASVLLGCLLVYWGQAF